MKERKEQKRKNSGFVSSEAFTAFKESVLLTSNRFKFIELVCLRIIILTCALYACIGIFITKFEKCSKKFGLSLKLFYFAVKLEKIRLFWVEFATVN